MGYVVVVSVPFIVLMFIIGLGCYMFGKSAGRREAEMMLTPVYGAPTTTPPTPPLFVPGTPPPPFASAYQNKPPGV